MKRIMERDGFFYPQRHHWLWGWQDCTEDGHCDDGLPWRDTIRFTTLDAAQQFFEPKTEIIHTTR